MKKTLLTILCSTFAICAFANNVAESTQNQANLTNSTTQNKVEPKKPTHPAFNRHDIVCGDKILKHTENVDSLADSCKDYKYKENKATFIDGHSGEHIMCQVKDGQLISSTCAPLKRK